MLQLNNIIKTYTSGDGNVEALKGVSLEFRKSEFVSILGQSGCGKTTLLNIIGGLDRYTSGDLIINGKSTKTFKDSDWDTYRNHSIGFVFQSYNLIPHQSVLANVELALTLSGVSKGERRERAISALKQVGLEDQINKKPTQMSGGQMQRVAIARALVNNPDILLADEPTGALDTKTSVQIMDILKEIAKDRLVIMVTHNPELAERYSTRIVRLSDGLIVDDTNPYHCEEGSAEVAACTPEQKKVLKKNKKDKDEKKPKMSFLTALSLSMNNLFTKKGRTVMTSLAGSIGIIGIALILSLSNGIQLFINQVQEDTLSTYPLSIQKESQDYSAMLSAMTSVSNSGNYDKDAGLVYVDDSLGTMMSAMTSTVSNNLEKFKEYLDNNADKLSDKVSDIQYTYDLDLQIYAADGKTKVGLTDMIKNMGEDYQSLASLMENTGSSGMNAFSEMINNQTLLDQQYELVDGHWPSSSEEVVLVIGKNNQISKLTLYMLGILDQGELEDIMKDLMTKGEYDTTPMDPYKVEDFLGMNFYLLTNSDFYVETDKQKYTEDGVDYPVWKDIRNDIEYSSNESKLTEYIQSNGKKLTVSGIIRPRVDATSTSISGVVGYTKGLTDALLEKTSQSDVIKQQKTTPNTNVLTGLKFERTKYTPETIGDLISRIDEATMEQFYAYMTKTILEDENFSSRLNVTDKESFLQIFFLMPSEYQSSLIEGMLNSALYQNPEGTNALCAILTYVGGNSVTITPQNLVKLLPVMSNEQLGIMLSGYPALGDGMEPVSGLCDLAGEQTMTSIYSAMSEQLKGMTVNKEIFLALLGTMDATDKEFITLEETLYSFAPSIDATLNSNLKLLGDAEKASPASINFYAKDFESKEYIEDFIASYNSSVDEKDKLQYTDLVGALMSSVSTIINVISYVLIAFVAISLVVSSIMIGIITNISVLERTKEIGILRAIGASKKDVSRVFNAETFIIGLCAGVLGILITIILCIPTNAIIQNLTGFSNIKATLPVAAAFILIAISMLLTVIAGLIPSRSAAKKDPVEALRSE